MLFHFSNSAHHLAKLFYSPTGMGKGFELSPSQHGGGEIDVFKRSKHLQVHEKDKPQFVHPSETGCQGNEEAMEPRDGRVRVIVIDLSCEGEFSQTIDDSEDIDLLRTPGIAGLARDTDPNSAGPVDLVLQTELKGPHHFMWFHPHGVSGRTTQGASFALVTEQGIFTRQDLKVLTQSQTFFGESNAHDFSS
jgi:hypothetical protein